MGCAVLVVFFFLMVFKKYEKAYKYGNFTCLIYVLELKTKLKKSKKHRLAVLENKLFLKIRFWKLYYTAHKKVCQISLIIVFIFIFIFFPKQELSIPSMLGYGTTSKLGNDV